MESKNKELIRVHVKIEASIEHVWKCWITPSDIVRWHSASDDWHTPRAENDLRPGGKFNYRMEAKDGSMGFDFWGNYDKVITLRQIDYILGDGRIAKVLFSVDDDKTEIVETFEAEGTNTLERQRYGWQCILDNFKKYVESNY